VSKTVEKPTPPTLPPVGPSAAVVSLKLTRGSTGIDAAASDGGSPIDVMSNPVLSRVSWSENRVHPTRLSTVVVRA
jgi:hypothetical protein